MAAHTAWVLNLDAEYELADPRGYTPSRATLARVAAQAARGEGLVRAGDVLVTDDTALPAGAYVGAAWCPTPRALARLGAAGATLPPRPPLEVLQRVNHRRFGVELSPDVLGSLYVETAADALALLAAASPSGRWVAKRAFGLAGRGQRRFGGAPDELDRHWVEGSFKLGHGLVIEPWVAREADFVLHGIVDPDGDLRLGRALEQDCDARGMWQQTRAAAAGALLEDELHALGRAGVETGEALARAGYFGPFGIDAFRYRDASGARAFVPRVEINARYCMGWGLSGL